MGCGGGCGGSAPKSNSYKPSAMKNWGGMKIGNSSGKSRGASSSKGYGKPSVRMSFSSKKR